MQPHVEIFGVTEASATVCVRPPCAAPVVLRLGDAAPLVLPDGDAVQMARFEKLEAGTDYRLALTNGGVRAALGFRTLDGPEAREVASFATIDDPHFGEPSLAVLGRRGSVVEISGGGHPHWELMNEDAVDEINVLGVDAVVVKGDVTHDGRPEQFAAAARTLARLRPPCHVILGNHDAYGGVDGYQALCQPRAPRNVEIGGWCLLLLDTVDRGGRGGILPQAQRRWIERALARTGARRQPTLVLMHHQPVPEQHTQGLPDSIGLADEASRYLVRLLSRHPQVRGVLAGHTHRNHLAWSPGAAAVPLVEVSSSKDFPGVYAHYRLYEDGTFRQEVRRISSPRALRHSARCEAILGPYRGLFLGGLASRSFATSPTSALGRRRSAFSHGRR